MRKKYRYSIFIASAILACAPLAISNTMGINHVVKAAVEPNQNNNTKLTAGKSTSKSQTDGSSESNVSDSAKADNAGQALKGSNSSNSGANNNSKVKSISPAKTPNVVQDGTKEAPYQITTKYDQGLNNTKIKLVQGLTDMDVVKYFRDHTKVSANDTEITEYPYIIAYNEKGQNISTSGENVPLLLENGYKLIMAPDSFDLQPEKWYSWQICKDDSGDTDPIGNAKRDLGTLPKEINDRIKQVNGVLTEETDDKGALPSISSKKDGAYFDLGRDNVATPITFIISSSTDPDAVSIKHNKDYIGAPANVVDDTPVVPDGGDKNKDHDADDEINDDNDSNSSNWDNAPVDNGTNFTFTQLPTTTKNTETNTKNTDIKDNNKPAVNLKNLVLIHDAIVYDKNGKAVLKHGAYQMKQMHHKIVILDHGKKYRINGQWFYRIGKNEYIKVSSVGTVSKAQKIHTRGTIKASHRYGVKLYSSNGKYLKKFLSKSKKVQFDQKKFMKHAVFYRIKGTKIWVRAANVKLVKGSRK